MALGRSPSFFLGANMHDEIELIACLLLLTATLSVIGLWYLLAQIIDSSPPPEDEATSAD